MARAIVTYARGWQALSITRSLGQQGIEVYCGEESGFAPSFFSKYCKGSFRYPSVTEEPERFIEFMIAKVKELRPPDGEPYVLIPVHKETWLLAEHRAELEPYITLPVTSYDNMSRTHDKGRLPELANELGIRIPETVVPRSLEEVYNLAPCLSYPRFLKMREGASGVGLKKVDSPEELTSSYSEFVDGYDLSPDEYPLIQEFIPGEDYCVTTLFDHGRCVAKMTYRNLRAFPRQTGAGALREAVPMPEAEAEAVRLLEHLDWHGIAELDFRKSAGGDSYLIEVNPRFFGGLPQAVAANVDYPHLLYRIAAGEIVAEHTEVDYSVRTETPITGLLATLDEIAHDDALWSKFDAVRRELGHTVNSDVGDVGLRPFWAALKRAANPRDMRAYLGTMFEKHQGTVDDVLSRDDPWPVLGFLYPVAMMLKHGKLSVGVLTSEAELEQSRPRRRLRDYLRQPTWKALALTALIFAVSLFVSNWDYTDGTLAWLVAFPGRCTDAVIGAAFEPNTLMGSIKLTAHHVFNLTFYYFAAAFLMRQSRTRYRRRLAM